MIHTEVGPPLWAAASQGYEEAVRLLKHRANVDYGHEYLPKYLLTRGTKCRCHWPPTTAGSPSPSY